MRSTPQLRLVWVGAALAALILGTVPAEAQSKGPPSATPTSPPGKDKVDRAKDKAEEKIDKAKDKAEEKIDKAKDKAEEAIDKAKEKAEEAIDKAKEKGAEKVDEAAKATEKAARATRKKAQREALRARMQGSLKGAPMAKAMKQELERHARRMARLERIKEVAEVSKDDETKARADKLLEKEKARHDKFVANFDAKAAAKGGAK